MHEFERTVADLMVRGVPTAQIADELGVSARTIQRAKKLPEVQRMVSERIRAEDPTIDSTLRAALHATKRDGSPDHSIRLQALKLLLQVGATSRPETATPTVVKIYKREPKK